MRNKILAAVAIVGFIGSIWYLGLVNWQLTHQNEGLKMLVINRHELYMEAAGELTNLGFELTGRDLHIAYLMSEIRECRQGIK